MKVASPGTVIVLLAGTIPVLTFVVERWVTRNYIDPALAASAGQPTMSAARRQVSEQYFASEPSAAHRPGSVHVILPDLHLELGTDSGVFSPRRLDPGTRLLLDVAPPPPAAGNLLDLGCGYGPLALRAGGPRARRADLGRRRERQGAGADQR